MAFLDFEIQEVLHRTGNSTVYLATDRREARLVALKVRTKSDGPGSASASMIRDPIGALHPNIVQTLESGIAQDGTEYVAMEWCPNGSLGDRFVKGMTTGALAMVVNRIAEAIDAMYLAGYSHGDIKPSNILFRENGEPVLIDAVTRAGSSTEGYRSPEFEKTGEVSRASDFYSLGVVLYRGLAGEVPWRSPDGRPRSRREGDALPELPEQAFEFKHAADCMLAFEPEGRPSSAVEVRELLQGVDAGRAIAPSFDRSDLVSTEEILTVAKGSVGGGVGLAAESSRAFRLRWIVWPGAVAGLVIAAGVILYLLQGISPPIAERLARMGLADHPGLADAWQYAESLNADPNQSLSAITAAYNAVLEFSSEHEEAKLAIDAARSRWKSDISASIDEGNLALSRSKLNDGLAIYPDDADFLTLFDRIATRNRVEALLEDTRVLLDRSGIEADRSATMAIHNYLEVTRLDSENEEARSKLDELAEHFGSKAAVEAEEGALAQAIELLGTAAMASSELPYLEEVRQVIRMAETLRDQIAAMLQQAGEYRSAGQLIEPEEANAADLYHQVLAIDPENGIAAQGLSEISSSIVKKFETDLAERRFAKVEHDLARAVTVGLDQIAIGLMQERLADVRQQIESAGILVQEAVGLMEIGLITQPIERNAVSQLREALRLDPNHPQAERLLHECASRLVAVAEEAYAAGMKSEASLYLDLALTVQPDEAVWRDLRRRWLAEASSTLHHSARKD